LNFGFSRNLGFLKDGVYEVIIMQSMTKLEAFETTAALVGGFAHFCCVSFILMVLCETAQTLKMTWRRLEIMQTCF